jgi:hypothetical protein
MELSGSSIETRQCARRDRDRALTKRRRSLNVSNFVIPRTAQSLLAASSGHRNALLDLPRKFSNATQQNPGMFSPRSIPELGARIYLTLL